MTDSRDGEPLTRSKADRFRSEHDWSDVVDTDLLEVIEKADERDDGLGYLVSNPPQSWEKFYREDNESFSAFLRMPLPANRDMEDLNDLEFLEHKGDFFGLPKYSEGDVFVRTAGLDEESERNDSVISLSWYPKAESLEDFEESYQEIARTANKIHDTWEDEYESGTVPEMLE